MAPKWQQFLKYKYIKLHGWNGWQLIIFGPDIDDYGQMGLRADYCLTIGSTFIFWHYRHLAPNHFPILRGNGSAWIFFNFLRALIYIGFSDTQFCSFVNGLKRRYVPIHCLLMSRDSKRNITTQNKAALGSRGHADTSLKIKNLRSIKTTGKLSLKF
jgi:hypothetical protein